MLTDAQLQAGVSEVVETMFFRTVEPAPLLTAFPSPSLHVRVSYQGETNGVCAIVISNSCAARLAADFLADSIPVCDGKTVEEVSRELCNVLCGHLLSRAAPDSLFHLSPPESYPYLETNPEPNWRRFTNDDNDEFLVGFS